MRPVTQNNELYHTHEWVVSHTWMSAAATSGESESWHTYEWGKSHVYIHHLKQNKKWRHTYEYMYSYVWHVFIHVTCIHTCDMYSYVWRHFLTTWLIHVTDKNIMEMYSCIDTCDVMSCFAFPLWAWHTYKYIISIGGLIHEKEAPNGNDLLIHVTHLRMRPPMAAVWKSCPTWGWGMSYKWMSYVTHMNGHHSYLWEIRVMSHVWMGYTTRMNELCHAYEWVMSHTCTSQVTHENESRYTYEEVMSHIWMSHVTYMNESCHTYDWVLQPLLGNLSHGMGWLRLVGSLKLQVSFAEYRLFYWALLQKRPIILRSLLIVATPYEAIQCCIV